MNTRDVVMKLMPAFIEILKERFPNLTAMDAVHLAGKLSDAVLKVGEGEKHRLIPRREHAADCKVEDPDSLTCCVSPWVE